MIATAGLNRPLVVGDEERMRAGNISFEDHSFEDMFEKRLNRRDNSTRENIIVSLVGFNIGILMIGVFVSRNLAKLTFAPIERAMMKQSQFIFDVSHELKTPLTAMLLRNEIALRKKNLLEDKAREVIQKNIEEIQKMKDLTGAMLDVAREDGEKENEEEVDVAEFVLKLSEKMKPVAEKQGVKIENEVNVGDNGNAKLAVKTLEQILTVFLDNAIKYSKDMERGEIREAGGEKTSSKKILSDKTSVMSNELSNIVRKKKILSDKAGDAVGEISNVIREKKIFLRATRRGKNLFFSVKDNGIGIKKEDQKRIFERFYQVNTARTREGSESGESGHGLGLAIAKNLAERQGYRIVLKSAEGAGAEFEVGV